MSSSSSSILGWFFQSNSTSNSTSITGDDSSSTDPFLPDDIQSHQQHQLGEHSETYILGKNENINPEEKGLSVQFLFLDENPFMPKPAVRPAGTFAGVLPMRTNTDKLLYGCGAAYFFGLSAGGAYGILRGLQTARVPNFKVRLNSVLNQTTRYGPWAANSLGVLSMGWALIDSGLEQLRDGKKDYYNHVSAAFLAGCLFKSTAGLRPAVLTGTLLASVVGGFGILTSNGYLTSWGYSSPLSIAPVPSVSPRSPSKDKRE